MIIFVALGLRGSHAGPALHEIICSQITAGCFEVRGGGRGGWPLTFFIETTEKILAHESYSKGSC